MYFRTRATLAPKEPVRICLLNQDDDKTVKYGTKREGTEGIDGYRYYGNRR